MNCLKNKHALIKKYLNLKNKKLHYDLSSSLINTENLFEFPDQDQMRPNRMLMTYNDETKSNMDTRSEHSRNLFQINSMNNFGSLEHVNFHRPGANKSKNQNAGRFNDGLNFGRDKIHHARSSSFHNGLDANIIDPKFNERKLFRPITPQNKFVDAPKSNNFFMTKSDHFDDKLLSKI